FKKPCFLAGGLTPETVEAAMKRIAPWMPYALDVSSGIEQNGYKDKEKMEAFMNAIRRLSL
ncbi:MAG: phosphoribosylanthranilate isomerase, partial [Clostridiales bacterium]|nr:phosphoribosylanthranilate isomerase [Clostridiales bacterium]